MNSNFNIYSYILKLLFIGLYLWRRKHIGKNGLLNIMMWYLILNKVSRIKKFSPHSKKKYIYGINSTLKDLFFKKKLLWVFLKGLLLMDIDYNLIKWLFFHKIMSFGYCYELPK